jgi:glutamate-ammonia-ligase adenylyltransferase
VATTETSHADLVNALARAGFALPVDAARHLVSVALTPSDLRRVAAACAEAPDPDLALAQLCRWIAMTGAVPGAGMLSRLASVLGVSTSLGAFLARRPQAAEILRDARTIEGPKTESTLRASALRAVARTDDPTAAIRIWKRREFLRIACRDLAGQASVEEVGRELAHLAEAALHAALASLQEEHPPPPGARFAVIGMGKLGGEELNYASDIDVMFVYEAPAERTGYAWATRIAEGLLQRLAATTEEGQAFRVDASLRPEGKDGPLVRSLAGFRAYYERWAKPWEFQALLKARPVAGDATLGRQFLDLAAPFVYPERLSPEAIREIRGMKARIERERLGPREDPKTQLKVGVGGMVDVEFTVQLLQLVHGGREQHIRVPSTSAAAVAAAELRVIGVEHARWLVEAYRLLARVRNRLYLIRGRPIDALPKDAEELEVLARSLNYPGPGARVAFMEDYRRITRRCRQVCEDVFYGRKKR